MTMSKVFQPKQTFGKIRCNKYGLCDKKKRKKKMAMPYTIHIVSISRQQQKKLCQFIRKKVFFFHPRTRKKQQQQQQIGRTSFSPNFYRNFSHHIWCHRRRHDENKDKRQKLNETKHKNGKQQLINISKIISIIMIHKVVISLRVCLVAYIQHVFNRHIC